MDIRSRRTALGLSRKELAAQAHVDAAMLQLIELGLSSDDESKAKVEAKLSELEKPNGISGDHKPLGSGTPEA